MRVLHDVLKLNTLDGNLPDSPFEGCEALRRLHGVVSVPSWMVHSIGAQPPGPSVDRTSPPFLKGNFILFADGEGNEVLQ